MVYAMIAQRELCLRKVYARFAQGLRKVYAEGSRFTQGLRKVYARFTQGLRGWGFDNSCA
jgi:hypothetical protein